MPPYPDAKSGTPFRDGLEFQDFVVWQLGLRGIVVQLFTSSRYQLARGESLSGVEIKLDRRCTDTERLSIEIAEKSSADRADWVASGIMAADNAWLYVQGNERIVFGFAKRFLLNYFEHAKPEVHEQATIRKFYLPFERATQHAAFVFRFGAHP